LKIYILILSLAFSFNLYSSVIKKLELGSHNLVSTDYWQFYKSKNLIHKTPLPMLEYSNFKKKGENIKGYLFQNINYTKNISSTNIQSNFKNSCKKEKAKNHNKNIKINFVKIGSNNFCEFKVSINQKITVTYTFPSRFNNKNKNKITYLNKFVFTLTKVTEDNAITKIHSLLKNIKGHL